jgi:hypothetical protein
MICDSLYSICILAFSALKMEAAGSSERLVPFFQSVLPYTLQDNDFHSYHAENLKPSGAAKVHKTIRPPPHTNLL